MAPILKFIGLALLCSMIVGGNCQCFTSDLHISQSQTGQSIQNKPVWFVNITNDCPCVQEDVKLRCSGFQTVQEIDPKVLANLGDGICLINDGNPLYGREQFNFTYAFDTQFTLSPLSSTIACS